MISASPDIPLKDPKDLLLFGWAVYALAFVTPVRRGLAQAIAIVVLLLGVWLMVRHRKSISLPRWESISLFLFLVLFVISSLGGGFSDARLQLGKIWVLLCFFPIAAFSSRLSRRAIGETLLWATVLSSVIGVVRFYFYNLDRAAALSGGYTTLAFLEAGMLPLALALFWKSNKKRKWLYVLAIIALALGLFLTETRAGWLAALIGLVIVGYYYHRKATITAVILALIVASLLPQSRNIIEKRMENDKPGGITSGRAILWSYAMTPLSHLPLFGYGPGSFNRLMPMEELAKTGDMGINSWHSTPLETLMESGPLALIALLCFAFLFLVRAWKGYFPANVRLPFDLGLFAALIALYIAGLTTNLFRDLMLISFVTLLWAMIPRADKSKPYEAVITQ